MRMNALKGSLLSSVGPTARRNIDELASSCYASLNGPSWKSLGGKLPYSAEVLKDCRFETKWTEADSFQVRSDVYCVPLPYEAALKRFYQGFAPRYQRRMLERGGGIYKMNGKFDIEMEVILNEDDEG